MSTEPIPRKHITAMLLHVERRVNEAGWDKPPCLGILTVSTKSNNNVMGLHVMNVAIPNPPGAFVEYVGQEHLEDPAFAQTLVQDYGDEFYGVVFMCEVWMGTMAPSERDGRALADIPGSLEARQISAVDIHGRQYFINRVRGQKARTTEDMNFVELAGRVYQGLHNMVLGTVRQMPGRADLLSDLETILIKTPEESEAAVRAHMDRQ